MKLPYSKKELRSRGDFRTYNNDATQAAFLLGGIGTGNVSLGARGELRDWEIFNTPGKGRVLPYSFFGIWAQRAGAKPVARVLEAQLNGPHAKSHGYSEREVAGMPRLDGSALSAEYPFARVEFRDGSLPVKVSLEAFTPFVPLNADDSSIPGTYICYRVKNPSRQAVRVSIAGSLTNIVGFEGNNAWGHEELKYSTRNRARHSGKLHGIFMDSPRLAAGHLTNGSMVLATTARGASSKPEWLSGGWCDGLQDFWDDFCKDGRLTKRSSYHPKVKVNPDQQKHRTGSLAISATLQPGAEQEFEFILSWYFPNRCKDWNDNGCDCSGKPSARNYYAKSFKDAWGVAVHLDKQRSRLEQGSRDFSRSLYSSTLPDYVIEALADNISVIRSTTCFRIGDGTLLGWEGCFDDQGCCMGSCTHVWNYTQTMAFLFPELERTMRRVEFGLETEADGRQHFRSRRVFGLDPWKMLPAADGQMGTIVRLYRDWKLCGDDRFLRQLWPGAKRALDYAFKHWDKDGDCVMESQQHNTYDIEFYGPNSLTNSIFYAALKAGAEMAEHLGDSKTAERWRKALAKGSKKMDSLLWGGEYYVQKLKDVDAYRYQYGKGCLSDQLLGQFLAHVAGLGHVLPRAHVKQAVRSIFKYNFRSSFAQHENCLRTYALNDEQGLVLCSWPKGGRPKLPFPYCDEVWTGIEYQVAAHLVYEGSVDEGLSIVKAVRDRHDGYRRNPWNEVECGHHYARSLASWGMLTGLSGFECDMVKGQIGFSPAIDRDNFRCFWSTGKAWGVYHRSKDKRTGKVRQKLEVLYGSTKGVELKPPA